jgi:hypothetical protein
MHHEELEKVREAVRAVLQSRFPELGGVPLTESVLLRGSRVAGHQFVVGAIKLRWLIGQDRLWLHEGDLAPRSFDLAQPVSRAQRAA